MSAESVAYARQSKLHSGAIACACEHIQTAATWYNAIWHTLLQDSRSQGSFGSVSINETSFWPFSSYEVLQQSLPGRYTVTLRAPSPGWKTGATSDVSPLHR